MEKLYSQMNSISWKGLDAIKMFLFLMLVFTIFAHTIGDNENSRLDTTIALVEDQTLSIDRLHENTGDKALINGKYYSDKAPLPSFLAVPSYWIVDSYFEGPMEDDYYLEAFRRSFSSKMEWARFGATVSVSAVAGAVASIIVYLISLELGVKKKKAILIGIISGTGTLIFPYSTTFHGTMLGSSLLISAVYLWIRSEYTPSTKKAFLISFLIGLGVSSSYLVAIPGGILLALTSVEKIRSYKLHLNLLTGLTAGLLPLLLFNFFTTGNPFEPTLFHYYTPAESLDGTYFGVSISLMAARILRGLFSPLNGLFMYSPLLLFGILGIKRLYRDSRKLFWLTAGGFGLTLIFLSSVFLWHVRTFYGPRYLLPSSILLLIPLAVEVKNASRFKRALIFLSGALSTLIMLGSTQPWLGAGRHFADREYLRQMVSLQIYENRLLEYILSLPSEGLQSPVISYLTGAATEFNMILSTEPQYHFPVGEILNLVVLYDTRYLAGSLVLLSGLLFFRKQLESTEYYRLSLGALLVIGTFTAGFSSTSFYMHDWYSQQPEEEVQWSRQNPEIHFISDTGREHILRTDFRVLDDKNLQIDLNGETVYNETVESGREKILRKIDVEKGLNRLEFKTDRCDVIGRFADNDDPRCTVIGIENYSVTELEENVSIVENFEEDDRGYYRVDDGSTILIQDSGLISLELEASSNKRTGFSVMEDGEAISRSKLDSFPSRFRTPYREVEDIGRFELQKNCEECEVSIRDFGFRKYSEQPENLTYRLGTNWYSNVKRENFTWGTGNASIMIYNYENQTTERKLSIEGRSFNRPREIEFVFNEEVLGSREVPQTSFRTLNGDRTENKFSFDVELRTGENMLELREKQSCDVIGDVIGNDDVRCVTYGLKDLYLTEK